MERNPVGRKLGAVRTEYDDHYWDVVVQRQFLKVISWLGDFITPEFRARVWQNGTKPWEYYEETVTEFFDDLFVRGPYKRNHLAFFSWRSICRAHAHTT